MRKFTLLAGTAALIALSGCTYDDGRYYGNDGYYGGGYYGDYYGPGYYDPYYNGADDWYFDGSYYFYYDRHSHRWNGAIMARPWPSRWPRSQWPAARPRRSPWRSPWRQQLEPRSQLACRP